MRYVLVLFLLESSAAEITGVKLAQNRKDYGQVNGKHFEQWKFQNCFFYLKTRKMVK